MAQQIFTAMGALIGLIALVYLIACAAFCSHVAEAKNKNKANWAIAGFFFGVLALIAIAGMPKEDKTVAQEAIKPDSSSDNSTPEQAKSIDPLGYVYLAIVVVIVIVVLIATKL